MTRLLVSRKMMVIAMLIVFIAACNVVDNKKTGLLNTGNIPLDEYTIDITRDTVLHTKRGAIINLPAGSIDAKNSKITLQLREAFSIADIVAAGLTTESNGTPLSSGGMIYINTAEQDGAKVVKPIGVSIPADYLQKGMELYRGEQMDDGSINWVEPVPLVMDTVAERIAKGRSIFTANCETCHDHFKESTGPPLAFLPQRRERKWMDAFIRNSAALIASGDRLANCVYNRWNKTAMTAFPNLTDDDLTMLYEYLENESKKVDPATIPDYKKCLDSCRMYEEAYGEYQHILWSLKHDNGPRVEVTYYTADSQLMLTKPPSPDDVNKVIPPYNDAVYYNFEINTFGWYNVDYVIGKIDNYADCKLTATVAPMFGTPDVFLIIPGDKIFQRGGFIANSDKKYGFYNNDGTLRLPQNVKAYIMALSEGDGKIMLGIKEFTTSTSMQTSIEMKNVSKAEFDAAFASFNFSGIDMQVGKTKNADSILLIDKELKALEALRPKGCDCSCGRVTEWDGFNDTAVIK